MKRTGEKRIGDTWTFPGRFDWKKQTYVFSPRLYLEGEYSVMVSSRSPGGIVAYYYKDTGFTQLVALQHTPDHLESTPYSVIDENIDFEWGDQVPYNCPELG